MTQPQEYYCESCGGTAITAEAHCYWDNVKQDFSYYDVADQGYDYCADCEDRTATEFRPITDLKTLAQIAIKREEAA